MNSAKRRFEITLTHALLLSTFFHAYLVSPFSAGIFKLSPPPPPEEEPVNVEFEIYQAEAREEEKVFIPETRLPEPSSGEQIPLTSQEGEVAVDTKTSEASLQDLHWKTESMDDMELTPSLQEKEAIKPVEDKTSDSLESEIELEKKKKESDAIKWDYCNRIRTLIENHAKLPDSLKGQDIMDVVKVEITLNRAGKLVSGTPKIITYALSRFPEINQAALDAVIQASKYFTPIPDNYLREEITFELPIRFVSGNNA